MSDWKSKRLDRIDSDGLSSASKPYRDGDYWCVTVKVSYDHVYNSLFADAASDASITTIGIGMNVNEDTLIRWPAGPNAVLLYPGVRGARNAVLEGLQALGRAFLCSRDWYTYYEDSIEATFNNIDLMATGEAQSPDTEALLERHLLFKGPVVDTRPFGSFARYQIGVHKYLIETGYGSPSATVAQRWYVALRSHSGLSEETLAVLGDDDYRKIPFLSWLSVSDPYSMIDDNFAAEFTEDPSALNFPSTWRLDTEAVDGLSKYVLGASWEGPGQNNNLFRPQEYKYSSFKEFEREVETLALHLTLRQEEHEELKNQRYYFKGTDTVLNFNHYAEVLRDCARQIQSFLLFNGIDLASDEIALGWYPKFPDPQLSNPTYNPDRSAFNFAGDQGATHEINQPAAYMFNMPNPPEAGDDQGTFYDKAYLVGEITKGTGGTYVREIERVGDWVRVKVLEGYLADADEAVAEVTGAPAPLVGVTGWIHDASLKTYNPPDPTELQNLQTLLEASGYLAYIRCPKKSSLDTESEFQMALGETTAPLNLPSSPAPAKKLQPMSKIKRRKSGTGHETDFAFRQRLNFQWIGFSAFLETPGFANKTIAQFFKSMNSINNRPGNDYDSLKFQACRGFPKPGASGAERLPLVGASKKPGFVDEYVLESHERRSYAAPKDASEITKYFDSFRDELSFAETKEDVDFVKEVTAAKSMRYAVANRNRTITDQAGDALFAVMPANVDKVRSWDDLYAYVLNRVDIPTIFYKLMDCHNGKYSLDDLIEYLCDAFLRSIQTSPEEVDRFFEHLEGKIVNASTIETGLGDRYNVELVDPYQLMQDIKTGMAELAAQNIPMVDSPGQEEITALGQGPEAEAELNVLKTVDDEAFYKATIAAIGDNPNNRMFLCELIMAGMFSLGALLYQAIFGDKDLNPIEANKLAKKLREEGAGVGKGCALPWLNLPDAISVVDKWLASILKQLEEKFYQYVQEKVFEPVNEALLKLVDCGEDDENYGLIPLDDLLPAGPEDPALGQKMAPLGIDDPRDFLSALVAILTPLEICSLLDGAPKTDTLIAIKGFMKANYPESYNILDSDIKVITFFQDLRRFFDTSVCLRDTYPPNDTLQNFCHDGETNRHAAIRASLSQKGLTDEEIDAQIEIDKQLAKEQVANIVQLATLGQGKEEPLASENTESKSFINDIMAASDSTRRQTKYAIDTMLEPINNAFVLDVGTFLPSLFSEIIKLRNLGLSMNKLPFYDILRHASSRNYESTYYNTQAGLNRIYMWAPRIEVIPGTRDLNPQSPNFMKYIPDTAAIKISGAKYQLTKTNPGNASMRYRSLPPLNNGKLDVYHFVLDGRKEANTNSGYTSATMLKLLNVSPDVPTNLGQFANMFLQNETFINAFKETDQPYQVSVFKALLAWSLKKPLSATSTPSYTGVYGNPKAMSEEYSDNNVLLWAHKGFYDSHYFSVINKNIKYDNFKFGVDNNVDMLSVVYDIIVESYNKKIAEITSNSNLFDIQRLSEINIYDSEDSTGLLGIKKLAQDASSKAQQLMRRIDFEGGEAPTHVSDAMFEGLVKAFVRLYVVEMIMSCIFMLSRFRSEDIFSDDLVAKFIKDRIEKVTFPDGRNIRERHRDFLYSQEAKLRKFMSEKEGVVVPNEEEIDNRVKKEIYKDKSKASEVFDELLSSALSSDGGSNEVRQVIEEVLGLALDPIEEEVLQYEASGATDSESEVEVLGPFSKPVIDEIVVGASDVNWNGLEDPYRWAHKIWVWKGSSYGTTGKEYISETDLEEKKKILRAVFDDDVSYADADEEGAESFGDFEKITPETATTTCLRELLSVENATNIAHPVEVPVGVDLVKGGTTWDPGETLTYPVSPPIVKNLGIISSLQDGFDIEISFEFTNTSFSGIADNTEVTDDAIDEFQEKLLTEYGLMNGDLESIDLITIDDNNAKFNSGFVEAALSYKYPPENWNYPLLAGFDQLEGWVDSTVLSEHDWQITSEQYTNRKAMFRVRSAPALTATYDDNTRPVYRGKNNGGFYHSTLLKKAQSNQKDWYPYPQAPSGLGPGTPGLSAITPIDINNAPKVDKVWSEQTYVAVLGNTDVGVKYSGLNRFRIRKKAVKVPVRLVVEEYTGTSFNNGTPQKGVVPKYRYEYEEREVNVLEEIISEKPVVQPAEGWLATSEGGSSLGMSAVAEGYSGEEANLVAGYAGPQQKEMWQTLNSYGVLDTNDFTQFPMIQIRPPVYWFNEDTHLGNPLTYGADQEHEIFVPDVKNFKLNIKGSNFDSKIKAYLQSASGLGAIYPFNIEVVSDKELKLEMPMQVFLGDRMFDSSPPDWWVPGWQNSEGDGEYEDQTGDVLTMAGIPVLKDTYVLVLDNYGERETGNMYFTTYNNSKRVWNDSFKWIHDPSASTKPELPSVSVTFDDDIDVTAPTTAFRRCNYNWCRNVTYPG